MRILLTVLITGLLALASVAADDPNWLANPGFEEADGERPAQWSLGMEGRGEGEAVWQRGDAHAGDRCLRVRLTTEGDYYMGRQALSQAVVAGALYQIAGWYRSDAEMVAHPCVYNVAADGHVISAWEAPLARSWTWKRFQYTWRPPEGTVRFEVQLRAQGVPGTAWFDDVFVGPATALEAEQRARQERLQGRLAAGELALRALRPSERPRLADLAQPERWEELQRADRVSLFAARGERESLGAVVLGLGDRALTATVTDLEGPRGRIPASAVRLRWVDWVTARGNLVPDPLWERQPFRAPAAGCPVLWVTVAVPRDGVGPGLYRGTLVARAGRQRATLPITLRVHDFALPQTTYLQSSFWVFRHAIRNAYGLKTVPFSFYRQFLDRCLETRLAPIDAAEWHDQPLVQMVRDHQGELQVDWRPWDQYLRYCLARGMSAFNVGDDHWMGSYFTSFSVRDLKTGKTETVKLERDSQEYADTVVRFYRLCHEHFTAQGWAHRAYLQGYDEPGNDPQLLAEIARFYNLARQGWPGLRTLITTPIGFRGLEKSIGIWCPLTPHYQDEAAAAARAQGQEVWWYVCCGPTAPWANFFLNQPGAAHRVLFWQTFGRRADGLLYWGINHWPDFCARTMDPLPSARKWPATPWNDGGRDGDGYFLYPGPDGPLTSLRFEIMRDGVEDYDALRMLDELVRTGGGTRSPALLARARRALEMTPDIYQSMTNYPADAEAMVRRRLEVNRLIEQLQSR